SSSARSFTTICGGIVTGPLGFTTVAVRGPAVGAPCCGPDPGPRCPPGPPRPLPPERPPLLPGRPVPLPGRGPPAPGPPGRGIPGRAAGGLVRTPPLPFGPPAGRAVVCGAVVAGRLTGV